MTARSDRSEALNRLAVAVLRMKAWESSIADDPKAAAKTAQAQTGVELAARDLTNAVDDAPPNERPKGWEVTPDGRTA